jgi:hypothetical protein
MTDLAKVFFLCLYKLCLPSLEAQSGEHLVAMEVELHLDLTKEWTWNIKILVKGLHMSWLLK